MAKWTKALTDLWRFPALWLAVFLFGIGLLVIPARLYVGDPYAWREEAISLLLHHSLEISPEVALSHGEPNQYFTQNSRTGGWYSKYGSMSGVINVIPLFVELKYTNHLPSWDSKIRRLILGIFYAALGALFGVALYFLCGHYEVSSRASILFVLCAIFCTFLGFYLRASNSEAYQLLLYTLFFERVAAYRKSDFRRHGCLYAAWFYLLMLVQVKFTHLCVAGIFGFGLLGWEAQLGKRGWELVRILVLRVSLPLFLIAGSVALANYLKFGSVLNTGYTNWQGDDLEHVIPPWKIFYNLFLTLQWGIPIHFPLVLLAMFGASRFRRNYPFDMWLGTMVFVCAFFLVGSLPIWKGEWGYGPRYFLFALPVLSLPALYCIEQFLSVEKRRKAGVKVLLTGTVSVALLSLFFQFQVARLDPFFCYWIRPKVSHSQESEITDYWDTANFAWITTTAWEYRDHPEDLWWMKKLKERLQASEYVKELDHLKYWLQRTNFYWWSIRD